MKPPSVAITFRSIDGKFKDMVIEKFHQIYLPHFLGGVWGFHGSPVDAESGDEKTIG